MAQTLLLVICSEVFLGLDMFDSWGIYPHSSTHEKNFPLNQNFQMYFLVAVVPFEVYSSPLSNVMLCQEMQAASLIVLKELAGAEKA